MDEPGDRHLKNILAALLEAYTPTLRVWPGEVGYGCNFCGAHLPYLADFDYPEKHEPGCPLIKAKSIIKGCQQPRSSRGKENK